MSTGPRLFGYTPADLELAAILVPPPPPECKNENGEYEHWLDKLERAAAYYQSQAHECSNAGGGDPLPDALNRLRRERNEIEQQMILLVAYMREKIKPRPYTLQQVADAAGLSVSGTRTFYDAEDIETLNARIAYAKEQLAVDHAARGTTPGEPSIPLDPESNPHLTLKPDGTVAPVWLRPHESMPTNSTTGDASDGRDTSDG